jgi:hypothetical protein
LESFNLQNMSAYNNGKTVFRGQDVLRVSRVYETDEWGNVVQNSTVVFKGNKVGELCGLTDGGLTSMVNSESRETISRSATFDEQTQVTTIRDSTIVGYASAGIKRLQCEAQSTIESITAHPDFQDLAGTPDEPKDDDALWIDSGDAAGTKRFVEFKLESLKGVSQYIAGNGSSLKITYFSTWGDFAQLAEGIGKIQAPPVEVWGFTNSWLLAGANAEPFGNRWKVTLVYKNASENFGQYDNSGWSTDIYS